MRSNSCAYVYVCYGVSAMIKYEIRQLVKSIKNNNMVTVFDSQFERLARQSYDQLKKDHPGEYLELVKVETNEECLDYTGKI